MIKQTFLTGAILAVMFAPASHAEVTMPLADDLKALVAASSDRDLPDYVTWVQGLADSPDAVVAGQKLAAGTALAPDEIALLARLLGVWNRVKNEDSALAFLAEAVAMPTGLNDDIPNNYENPEFVKFGGLVEKTATDFGLDYRNVDGRIFEVTLDGPGDDVFGILTHADVVPAGDPAAWVLEDGTQLDPYKMQIIGNNIYGRGTIDDKGSIATALYAMKAIKDSGLPLKRDIRLMIETTEETSGSGMEHYMESNKVPDYNIVLDSDYPAITAEKGYGTINAFFPITDATGDVVITNMTGGTASNQIPESAVATLATSDTAALIGKITGLAPAYVAGPGGNFEITATEADGAVKLAVKGVSAHASEPEQGLNPLPRLMQILVESDIAPAENHWLAASGYINTLFGADYLAEKIGLAFSDDFMGPLTLSPTFTAIDDAKGARVAVNIRAPRGMTKEELKSAIEGKLTDWAATADASVTFDVQTTDWMYRNPDGAWLNTVLSIFGDTTGLPAEPVSSAGSTTAKLLPNAINFGPNMPGDKYMGHNVNEFKRLDVFRYDLQMFTEMMVRISNLKYME